MRYFERRCIQTIITLFIVITINFFLFRVIPGDPVLLLINDPRVSKATMQHYRTLLGLDLPKHEQYLVYLSNLLHGELGYSFAYGRPVSAILGEALWNTAVLVIAGTALAIVLGLMLGLIAGWKRGTKTDISIIGTQLLMYSMPSFWLSMLMILVFAVNLGLFPTSGVRTYGLHYSNWVEEVVDIAHHAALPMAALSIQLVGEYALLMRASVLDVFTQQYIVTAKAKGLSTRSIVFHHALKNASLPMITVVAINLGYSIGGAIQTETVFAWPGIGRLMYDSVSQLDYPILQGCFLVLAVVVILANLCADLMYGYLDPRVRAAG